MMFRHFLLKVNEANAFLVACEAKREALLVDAGDDDEGIHAFLDDHGLTLGAAFITHDHYDHTDGLAAIVKRHGSRVYAGKDQAGGVRATRVRHGDEIRFGAMIGRVLVTPGHTPEGVSLALPGMVFTGDALFAGSVGGTSSPDAYRQQIDHIRRHILTLPPQTEIHPGHGPSSTVAVESRHNPFLQ